MVNVAVFASGQGTNFEKIVKANTPDIHVVLLIVDKEQAYAITRANQLHIPYVYVNPKAYASKEEYEQVIVSYLKQYEVELIALAGYMRFIGKVLLHAYPRRIVNLHPAYLPDFPGAHSIEDAFHAGVGESGVSIHYVDEGIDTGEIIYQEKVKIDAGMSLSELEQRIHTLEYALFAKVLNNIGKEILNEKSTD